MNLQQAMKKIAEEHGHHIEWDANFRYYSVLAESVTANPAPWDNTINQLIDKPEKIYWAIGLKTMVDGIEQDQETMTRQYDAFAREFEAEPLKQRRVRLAMEYFRGFSPGAENNRKTAKAFRKFLDLDTFYEAYRRKFEISQVLQEKAWFVIGHLVRWGIEENRIAGDDCVRFLKLLLREYSFESSAVRQIQRSTRERNRIAAAGALAEIASPAPTGSALLDFESLRYLLAVSQNERESVWVKQESFKLLFRLYRDQAMRLFRLVLFSEAKEADNNLFLRKWILETLTRDHNDDELPSLFAEFLEVPDPSDYVRMAAVYECRHFGFDRARRMLTPLMLEGLQRDISERVRARCAEAIVQAALSDGSDSVLEQCVGILVRYLPQESSMFAQRVCLEEMLRIVQRQDRKREPSLFDVSIMGTICRLIEDEAVQVKVRYWACIVKEKISFVLRDDLRGYLGVIEELTRNMRDGDEIVLPREIAEIEEHQLGRVLAFLSLEDFGYAVRECKGRKILSKGERFRFQMWRLIHELSTPQPDKRKNYRHTKGREFRGKLRAHSDLLGELTQTKVPGEPLVIWDAGSWRRHIPLVDDCLSVLRPFGSDGAVRLYSTYGTTLVVGPETFGERLRKYTSLIYNYAEVANLRNSHPGNKEIKDIAVYFRILEEQYGVKVTFFPYADMIGGHTFAPYDPALRKGFGVY